MVFALSLVIPKIGSPVGNELPVDVSVINPITSTKILPDWDIKPTQARPSLMIRMAANEYEPISIAIRSRNQLKSVAIQVTDLVGPNEKITSENVDIKLVKAWFQGDEAWYGRYNKKKTRNLVPELLLHDSSLVKVDLESKRNYLRVINHLGIREFVDISTVAEHTKVQIPDSDSFGVFDAASLVPFDLNSNFTQQVWITINSNGISPGTYKGRIVIQDEESRVYEMPLAVVVMAIRLCDPNIEYSIFYRGKYSAEGPTISSEFKSRKQLFAEFKDMRAHGITNPNVYQPVSPIGNLKEYLSIRRRAGFSNAAIYYFPIRTGSKREGVYALERIQRNLDKVSKVFDAFGVQELYLYGIDEAKGSLLRSQINVWKRLRGDGYKIFAAGGLDAFADTQSQLDLLVVRHALDRGLAKFVHDGGGRVFSYNNPQVGAEDPLIHRLNYGIDLWRHDYDGAMNYAYMTSFGSSWNDFDHKHFRDHNYVYPTTDGVISTIAWEGFREGVDDVRYIETLSRYIGGESVPTNEQEMARSLIDEIKREPSSDPAPRLESIKDLLVDKEFNCLDD